MTIPMAYGWRMATTEAGLQTGFLHARGLPVPTTSIYRDFTTRVAKSEGGQARHGYKNVRLFWDVLDRRQGLLLRELIQAGLTLSGLLYVTVDRANGTAGGPDWIDAHGRPHMPDFEPQSPIASATGIAYKNVELYINNVFVDSDPASF